MTEDDDVRDWHEMLHGFYRIVQNDPHLLAAFLIALAKCGDDEPNMPVNDALLCAVSWVMVTDNKRKAKLN